MFLGVVALDRQAEITELTLDIMAFFAERFDTIAGDFTLYVVANEEERIAKMEEVLGDTPPLQCGLAQGNVAFVQLWCANAIAHEYFHVLQEVWAPKAQVPASDTGWEWGAWWLFEGSAEYAEMRYFEMVNATDPDYYTRGLNTRERFMSFDPTPLRDLETYIPRFATTPFDFAGVAIDWLVGRTSETAVVNYFRLLPESTNWHSAFLTSFGMTVDEFYEGFAAHTAEAIPVRREVRGVVLGPDGEPVSRWRIDVLASPVDSDRAEDGRDILFGGVFGLLVPDGTYELWVRARCAHRSPFIGWHAGEAGVVLSRDQAERVVVAGSDLSGIEIRLAVEPSERHLLCDFGPLRAVSGTVVGPDGQPLRGVRVDALDRVRYGGLGQDAVLTGDDGSFVLHLPDGVFSVAPLLFSETQPGRIVDAGTGWLTLWNDQYVADPESVTVEGADVSGVRIQILKRDIPPVHLE